jgi:two-component system sensor histidine kinase/response regulator
MDDSNPTILAVDDDPIILASVADILRVARYNTLTATNGVEGLNVMQQRVPDLIVADIMMPEMDGYQFYEAVRENPAWIAIPFIFLSAKGERKDIRRGYDLGADHYLTKPFEPEDLLIAIRSRLQRVADIQAAAHDNVEQMKRQLLNIFGHELRTPLSYIYGYMCLLQEEESSFDEEAKDEIMQGMRKGIDRLLKLVEDLLLIVYIDSGAAAMELERHGRRFDVRTRVEEAVSGYGDKAQAREINITMIAENGLVVQGIPKYIRDAVVCLVDNAIKFGKAGGHVWIRAESDGAYAVVSVRDDGVGIPLDKQKYLFERFSQIDRDKMEQQGVGLGLAIAERLVRLHGGSIQVESQPGEGSTFTICLPMAVEDPDIGASDAA